MKRIALVCLAGLMTGLVNAQEIKDTVSTSGNTQDVYYDLNSGDATTADRDNWDIAFESKGFTASVLINGQKGTSLFTAPYEISDWANFDTAGYNAWPTTKNSSESWSGGAFNQNLSSDFDLGWGIYNPSNHVITGDSVFLISLADGSFRKIYVNELSAGTYKFTYADVDGQNEKTVELKKGDIGAENFGFYSIVNEQFVIREPDTETWDLIFTKYVIDIPIGGGQFMEYPVSGVKINKHIQVAQRDGIAVSSDDTTNLNWSMNISEIGSDWKSWSGTEYVYVEDRAYFVKLSGGQMWKIYFTKFEGGPMGNYHFVREKMASGVGINKIEAIRVTVYPNPTDNQNVTVQLEDNTQLKQVRLYNSAMQLLSSQSEAILSTSELTGGMYFLSIETSKGTAVKSLIVQ